MVERLHRQLKDALPAQGAAHQWEDHLPWVHLGLRAVPKDESGVSAAEAALGQQLKVPGQAPTPHVVGLPAAQLLRPPGVYVRKGGAAKPFHVLEQGTKSFKLQLGERMDAISWDRLKPHLCRS